MRTFTLMIGAALLLGSALHAMWWQPYVMQLPAQVQHPYWHSQPYPHNDQARDILARALIASGQPTTAPHWRHIAPYNSYWQQQRRGADLFRSGQQTDCTVTLRFHQGQPLARLTAQRLVAELEENWGSQTLSFCIEQGPPVSCEVDSGRAYCALPEVSSAQVIPIGLAPTGRANTRNGEVFMAVSGSYRLFQHELGHALGLADEYPMRYELAQQFCSGEFNFTALNIVVTKGRYVTPAEYERISAELPWQDALEQRIGVYLADQGRWLLGSPAQDGVGLYPADTCQGTNFQAWKPVPERTFMEQHEIGSVPELYLELIEAFWQRQ